MIAEVCRQFRHAPCPHTGTFYIRARAFSERNDTQRSVLLRPYASCSLLDSSFFAATDLQFALPYVTEHSLYKDSSILMFRVSAFQGHQL